MNDATSGKTMRERWTRVAQLLRAELGDDLYNSWFTRLEPEGFETEVLTLSVPTRFLKSWLDTHYHTKIALIAAREFGPLKSLAIKLRAQGQAAQQSRPQSAKPSPRPATNGQSFNMQSLAHAAAPLVAAANPSGTPVQAVDETQTFDNFKVGASNQLAHAAASRVAQSNPGSAASFNPLFIHAAAGYGKTHLLNAVANRIAAEQPNRKVLMLTAERFMYRFIHAVRQRDTLSFKDQFQSVDVLLIDDFQFLQGRAIQQEFCHAFNSLVDQRRQVIVAADVPPAQLDSIDQRMRSRLLGGLVVDIEAPDLPLRREILQTRYEQALARDPAHALIPEILDLIAERVTGSGRELEGALNKVLVCRQLTGDNLTVELASMLLRELPNASGEGRVKIEDILKVIGRHYNVGRTELLSPRRARSVVMPRQIGMYLAKKLTNRSLPEIGRRFGGRDHSTVLHAVRKIEDQIKGDEKLAKEVSLLVRLVEQGVPGQ